MISLWEGDIDILDMSRGMGLAVGARRIEIFLDYVLAQNDDPAAYLTSPAFRALWSPKEHLLAKTLEEAFALLSSAGAGPAASSVASQLERFVGGEETQSHLRWVHFANRGGRNRTWPASSFRIAAAIVSHTPMGFTTAFAIALPLPMCSWTPTHLMPDRHGKRPSGRPLIAATSFSS